MLCKVLDIKKVVLIYKSPNDVTKVIEQNVCF